MNEQAEQIVYVCGCRIYTREPDDHICWECDGEIRAVNITALERDLRGAQRDLALTRTCHSLAQDRITALERAAHSLYLAGVEMVYHAKTAANKGRGRLTGTDRMDSVLRDYEQEFCAALDEGKVT